VLWPPMMASRPVTFAAMAVSTLVSPHAVGFSVKRYASVRDHVVVERSASDVPAPSQRGP